MLIATRVNIVRQKLIPPLHLCFSSKFCGIYLQLASRIAITMDESFLICQKISGYFCHLNLQYFDHLPSYRGPSWTFGALPTPCPRGHRKT